MYNNRNEIRKEVRRELRREEKNNKPIFEISTIIKYIVMGIIFSAIIYGVRTVVMTALAASPTGKVGNGMVSLYEVHNTGAAFNLLHGQPEMLIMASFLAVAIISFIVIVMSARLSHNAVSSMALLASGIVMNLSERLAHGFVIDYIHLDFMPTVPMFNTADIMIIFGALGIIISLFNRKE